LRRRAGDVPEARRGLLQYFGSTEAALRSAIPPVGRLFLI